MIGMSDLPGQFEQIRDEILAAILPVMESGAFALGPAVGSFEKEFAAYCHSKEAVGMNSGTSGLHLALLAAGIGEGDEVITVSHTFVATVAAIRYTGATPVLIDIDPDMYLMDVSLIEGAITPKTRAIIPVHLYGQPCDMDPINEIAKRRNLLVIEDAAQSHGAEYKGRRCGSLGDMAEFSFYPGKNLGAFGEGGAVTTDNAEYAEKMRIMRHWGQSKRYHHDHPGYNYRMDGIQGAVLRVKLRYIEGWTELRRERAAWYDDLLADSPYKTPAVMPDARHVYHQYVIETDRRRELQEFLTVNGIDSGIHYPIPVHLQKTYADLGYKKGDLPVTERVVERILSLPCFPELKREEVETVVDALNKFQRL
ncbi:MAG: DegT/DnrJ/EryC1/StrS family aminotransferase [Candidatus Poribacteria bacterium]|nr:DegT/DnrJ/EryC1/StrS family aminotransferase [Candidatus Poribacteria bacterium]